MQKTYVLLIVTLFISLITCPWTSSADLYYEELKSDLSREIAANIADMCGENNVAEVVFWRINTAQIADTDISYITDCVNTDLIRKNLLKNLCVNFSLVSDEDKFKDGLETLKINHYAYLDSVAISNNKITGALVLSGDEKTVGLRAISAKSVSFEKTITGERTLIVFYFENNSIVDREKLEPLKKGISDMLISDLSKVKRLRTVPREKLQNALESTDLSNVATLSPVDVVKISQSLNSDVAITGSYMGAGTEIRIDAKLIDLKSMAVLADENVSGAVTGIISLEKLLLMKIIKGLDIYLSDAEKEAVRLKKETMIDAVLHHYKAINLHDEGKYDKAVKEYEEALKIDPDYAEARANYNNLISYRKTVSINLRNIFNPPWNMEEITGGAGSNVSSAYTRYDIDIVDLFYINRLSEFQTFAVGISVGYPYVSVADYTEKIDSYNNQYAKLNNMDMADVIKIKYPKYEFLYNWIYESTRQGLGYFNYQGFRQIAVHLSYGHNFTEQLGLGVNMKFLQYSGFIVSAYDYYIKGLSIGQLNEKIKYPNGTNIFGFGADVFLKYNLTKNVSAGLEINDPYTALKVYGNTDYEPFIIPAGISLGVNLSTLWDKLLFRLKLTHYPLWYKILTESPYLKSYRSRKNPFWIFADSLATDFGLMVRPIPEFNLYTTFGSKFVVGAEAKIRGFRFGINSLIAVTEFQGGSEGYFSNITNVKLVQNLGAKFNIYIGYEY